MIKGYHRSSVVYPGSGCCGIPHLNIFCQCTIHKSSLYTRLNMQGEAPDDTVCFFSFIRGRPSRSPSVWFHHAIQQRLRRLWPLWRPSNKDSGVFRPLWRPSNKGSGSGVFFAFGFSGRHDGHPSAEKAERLCLLAAMAAIQLGGTHQQWKHSTFAVFGSLRWDAHGGLSTCNCLQLCDQN